MKKTNLIFQTRTFCMMNAEEPLCRSYRMKVRCFEKIPRKFEFDGSIDNYCSFTFPPGYSYYMEEFSLVDYKNPDNFVLINGIDTGYKPKLRWEDREQTMWSKLPKICKLDECEPHPLHMNLTRRENSCIKSLKVKKNQIFYPFIVNFSPKDRTIFRYIQEL